MGWVKPKKRAKGTIITLSPPPYFTISPTTHKKVFLSDEKAEEYLKKGIPIYGVFKKYELSSKTRKKKPKNF